LLIAPYISKVYKKFKYTPGDVAYDRLRSFVDKMKGEKVGGDPNNQGNAKEGSSGSGGRWHSDLFFSASMLNLSMGMSGGTEPNPILAIVAFIIFAYIAIVVSISVGLFVFDILVMIKRAIFDDVKKAQVTGKVPEELERASPQFVFVVTQNTPANKRANIPPPPVGHKGPHSVSRWEKVDQDGETWYENVETGETAWNLPPGGTVVRV
jgi:hypothetical protein